MNGVTEPSLLEADSGLPRGVQGAADPRFASVVHAFALLFPGRRFGGGALAVYIDGRPVVDLWTGWSDRAGEVEWTADTAAMVFSGTKGVATTVIHRPVDRDLLSYDTPVAEYWPDFGANGKAEITVRDVLRHRSGLSHLKGVSKTELLDHRRMEERLAAAPVDHLRGIPAYHALTYGWLLSGLARAVTGKGMRELIRNEVAAPLNTDGLHLGRPPVDGGSMDGKQFLSPELTTGLTGKRSLWPDLNIVVPMAFHLGYHGSPIPGLLGGFGHVGLGGTLGWADPDTGSAFAIVHNRLLTPMVLDMASFAFLAQPMRSAIANARKHGAHEVPHLGAPYPKPRRRKAVGESEPASGRADASGVRRLRSKGRK